MVVNDDDYTIHYKHSENSKTAMRILLMAGLMWIMAVIVAITDSVVN